MHLNRSPCRAKVEKITYREGQFLDARNPEAGKVNESNDLWLTRIESPNDKLIVRQISGAIARRIVCRAKEGLELVSGERFGMIKFGSRTERTRILEKMDVKNNAMIIRYAIDNGLVE